MGLFDGRCEPRRARADDGESLDHQGMAIELIDAVTAHDDVGLAALTPVQRGEQVRVRKALYDYVDRTWEDAKAQGLDPATRLEWSVVAGLRDLTGDLWHRAVDAQMTDDPKGE
jgi:hypothetical protein